MNNTIIIFAPIANKNKVNMEKENTQNIMRFQDFIKYDIAYVCYYGLMAIRQRNTSIKDKCGCFIQAMITNDVIRGS